jgi:hypothetical protein
MEEQYCKAAEAHGEYRQLYGTEAVAPKAAITQVLQLKRCLYLNARCNRRTKSASSPGEEQPRHDAGYSAGDDAQVFPDAQTLERVTRRQGAGTPRFCMFQSKGA